jgi:DNA (cytosine-5)-methyltransferase 3A
MSLIKNVVSVFDGMSCGQIALNQVGIDYENYYASEIDKYAIQITNKNFPNTNQMGSIVDLKSENLPEIDLLFGGSPCQDLSGLKNEGKGLEGEKSKLFWEFVRLKNELNPKYFLLENVVPRKKEWKEQIDKILGVEGVLINSDLFVEQNRPRYYWTNIPIKELPQRPEWNKSYFQWRRTYFRENKSGVCPCLTANMGTGGHNVPLKSKDLTDKLSPNECESLQGVPNNYTEGVSNTQRYKMLGNGWTVPVVAHIFSSLKD